MTTQWQQRIDAERQYMVMAPCWQAWKLRNDVGLMVYAFWEGGIVSTCSLQGILQKRWIASTGMSF